MSKIGGRDVTQFSADEILFCVRDLVLLGGIFVFRYLTKFFLRRIVRIFAVPQGAICLSPVWFSSSLTIRLPISVGVLHLHC